MAISDEINDFLKVRESGQQAQREAFERQKFLEQLAIQKEQLGLAKKQDAREELGAPIDRSYKEALTKASKIESKYNEKLGPMKLRQQRLESQEKMIDIENQKMNSQFMKSFFEEYLKGGSEQADAYAYKVAGVQPGLAKQVGVSPRDLADVSYSGGKLSVDFRRPNEILKELLDIQNVENQVKGNDPLRKEAIDLRKELISQQPIKEYISARTKMNYIDELYDKYLNGDMKSLVTLDQTLISGLNKMLEPDSVTREAEFLRTTLGSAVYNQLVASFSKLVTGGEKIGPQERAALVQTLHIITNARGNEFNNQIQNYKDIAKAQGYDESLIFGQAYRPHEDYDTSLLVKSAATTQGVQGSMKNQPLLTSDDIEAVIAPSRKAKNGNSK